MKQEMFVTIIGDELVVTPIRDFESFSLVEEIDEAYNSGEIFEFPESTGIKLFEIK